MMRKVLFALSSLALTASGMTPASASHPTQICLDVDSDQASPMSNDDVIDSLWAYPGATDADHPPEHQGCVTERTEPGQDWGGTNIDFEVTGVSDPDDSNSPSTPDLTCTVGAGAGGCSVSPPSSSGGSQQIRAWIDFDSADSTVEADTTEGYDEDAEPGEQAEPDATDVAVWMWTHGDPPPAPCGHDEVCWGRVSIKYEPGDHRFHGRIAREHGSCGTGSVTLRKKQSGDSREIFEAQISGQRWEAKFERRVRGRFYATLSRTRTTTFYSDWPRYTCEGDRSPVLKVD
jgi:hypothetical protein